MLSDDLIDDAMVANGLQHLHGLDLAHDGVNPNLRHHGRPGTYLRSHADVVDELQAWRRRCEAYDRDPVASTRSARARARQTVGGDAD